jgi:ribonucleoside-diphosphate reductase alpha chain
VEDVAFIYNTALTMGLKGVTIYRDGSKTGQVLVSTEQVNAPDTVFDVATDSDYLYSRVYKQATPQGTLWVTVTDGPNDVFLNLGKAGSDIQAMTEAIGRLISQSLQNGVRLEAITEQLMGIGGATSTGFGPGRVLSVPDAIAKVLAKYYTGSVSVGSSVDICPDCGNGTLVHEEGCAKCSHCGYSKC